MRLVSEKGQAMVELALMLPVLVLIFLPLADIGRLFYFGMTLTQAVRSGAQYGISQDIVGSDDTSFADISSDMTDAAVAAGANIGLEAADVTTADRYWRCGTSSSTSTTFPIADGSCTGDTTNVYVRVIATKAMDSIFSFEWAGGSAWSVTRSAEIRVQ
jgi:Flp pilus assembly protein TadG